MIATVIEHTSPTRCRRGDAETEKTQRRFRKDRSGHSDAGLDQNGLNDVRQNMTYENSRTGCAQRSSSFDELECLDLEDLAPGQSRITHPADAGQRKNQSIETRAEKSHEGDRQEN